jgi:hypothetical protein
MKIKLRNVCREVFRMYVVERNGVEVGRVFSAWKRRGGWGWTHSRTFGVFFKRRKEAVANLIKNNDEGGRKK